MKDGFIRVAAYSPALSLANPKKNADTAVAALQRASADGAKLLVLPELYLTGYTCADLFFQKKLISEAYDALSGVISASAGIKTVLCLGFPYRYGNRLYNCAAVIFDGTLLGIVPKTHIPDYREFYEARYFAKAPEENVEVSFLGFDVTFGTKQIFSAEEAEDFRLSVEICEDLWVAVPPSVRHCAAGATVIANLSASNEIVGKDAYRKELVLKNSASSVTGYVYASAGEGESTTDLVFSGHNIVAENGACLCECRPFAKDNYAASEIDCARLVTEREKIDCFAGIDAFGYKTVRLSFGTQSETKLTRFVDKHPFVPSDTGEKNSRCDLILEIQSRGLARRVTAAYAKTLVIGLSGGLDSCLALLVAVRAMEILGRDNKDIIAVTMPCFGTTKRTKSNAEVLARTLGTSFYDIDIKEAVDIHFRDIGHDGKTPDVTFENSQARERTQILMDIANKTSGMVIGTGDLSELALGFATYNGDHMSMYGVNASVPKTLVRHVVGRAAEIYGKKGQDELCTALLDILATPVSPELLPPTDGEISQKTEQIVGPYELHDFFLYSMVRQGASPKKIFRLAKYAFDGEYDGKTVAYWLLMFVKRFFAQQFKRSCIPDGPKVGSVSLSPRSDFRMPSDAVADAFVNEAKEILESENGK